MSHHHEHGHWDEKEFAAFCKECGFEHLIGSTSTAVDAATTDSLAETTKKHETDLTLTPLSIPFDCAECITQIEPTCTEECFVTYDECNLCASQAESHPLWPYLTAHPADLGLAINPSAASCCSVTGPPTNDHCFQCEWANCNSCFMDKAALVTHVMQHLSESSTPSDRKVNGLPQLSNINDSKPTSTYSTPLLVESGAFSSSASLASTETFQCCWEECANVYDSTQALMEHAVTDHVGGGKSEYHCKWRGCYREHGFSQRQKVIRHLQGHIGDKPHQCEICDKRFSEKAALAQHLRTHSNERPYSCPHEGCEKTFVLASALTIHQRTHTGERPFKCTFPGCNAAFGESSNLRKHAKTHTGEKSYECPLPDCAKKFARSDQLARHMKIHDKKI